MEKKVVKNHRRLNFYHQILMSPPTIFKLGPKDDFSQPRKSLFKRNTKDVEGVWGSMDNEMKYMYNAKFEGNIVVAGRTGCGKTTFVQNLGKNEMFGDIKDVLWISKTTLSAERENNIRDCFPDQNVDFKYPADVEEFDNMLDFCQIKKNKL